MHDPKDTACFGRRYLQTVEKAGWNAHKIYEKAIISSYEVL